MPRERERERAIYGMGHDLVSHWESKGNEGTNANVALFESGFDLCRSRIAALPSDYRVDGVRDRPERDSAGDPAL